jgi:hypothetical protein
MSEPTTPAPATTPRPIGEVVVTPRPPSDYRNMFLLDDGLLEGPILDCPGGASPFGAQVRARGGIVVSVDPAYRQPPTSWSSASAPTWTGPRRGWRPTRPTSTGPTSARPRR